jgi:hypothetical protein
MFHVDLLRMLSKETWLLALHQILPLRACPTPRVPLPSPDAVFQRGSLFQPAFQLLHPFLLDRTLTALPVFRTQIHHVGNRKAQSLIA